jgi:hypothetical protein
MGLVFELLNGARHWSECPGRLSDYFKIKANFIVQGVVAGSGILGLSRY